ncbi:MAG: hypothetical protein AAF197_04410 [Pseudomonadota bacterium]
MASLPKHNTSPSFAVDAGPYFKELRNTDYVDKVAFGYFAGQVIMLAKIYYLEGQITHQVIWGGDWDNDGRCRDHKLQDLPHFEFTKEDVWNLSASR